MLISIVPTAALLVASATFVAYDYVAVRNEQIRLDQRLAESLAARTSPPVSLGNASRDAPDDGRPGSQSQRHQGLRVHGRRDGVCQLHPRLASIETPTIRRR